MGVLRGLFSSSLGVRIKSRSSLIKVLSYVVLAIVYLVLSILLLGLIFVGPIDFTVSSNFFVNIMEYLVSVVLKILLVLGVNLVYVYYLVIELYFMLGVSVSNYLGNYYLYSSWRKYVPKLSKESEELEGQYYRDFTQLNWMVDLAIIKSLRYNDHSFSVDIIRATLLQLTKSKYIKVVDYKGELAYKLMRRPNSRFLDEVYRYLVVESNKDDIITINDVENLLITTKGVKEFEDVLVGISGEYLLSDVYLTTEGESIQNQVEETIIGYGLTEAGYELRERWVKFFNYLRDYTLIDDRSMDELELWDELLIYATILGISSEVAEELDFDTTMLNVGNDVEEMFGDDFDYLDYLDSIGLDRVQSDIYYNDFKTGLFLGRGLTSVIIRWMR